MSIFLFFVIVEVDNARDKLGYNVTVSISNVSIHGLLGTGKTSVFDLATGDDPAMDHHSTSVVVPPQCSIIVPVEDGSSDHVEWEGLSPNRMLEIICETVRALTKLADERYVGSEQSISFSAHATSSADQMTPPAKRRYNDFPQILTTIMRQLPEVDESTTLFRARLVQMSDTGGQPNYLDVSPLFVRNKCLALFTLKLNEQLDAIPKCSYCVQGRPISMADTMLHYSQAQLLESLAKSMSFFLPSLGQSSDSRENGCFAVIGTFADKIDECVAESLEEKNAILAQNLKTYERLQIGKTILPINAVTSDEEQRRKYMIELQQLIGKAPSIKVTIKLRWIGFYLTLQSQAEQGPVLSLQECMDIGRSLDMDKEETRKAITFFHNLNLISYYEALSGFVFISLKPIFDLLSLLINVSLFNEDELRNLFGVDLPVGAREHFQQHGCFGLQTLHECFQFPDRLSSDIFISLLAEVKAIAIIKKSNEFFMPCVLRYASREEEHKIVSDQLSSPWIVRLKNQRSSYEELYVPLPPAFSTTLIVLLLSSDLFSIVSGVRQYRNIFVLDYRNEGDVIFIERQLQLEVYYSSNDNECSVIHSFVRKTILETEKRLSFNVNSITIEDSFPCSCSTIPKRDSRHILCKNISGRPIAQCEATRMKIELSDQDLRWLSSGMPLCH